MNAFLFARRPRSRFLPALSVRRTIQSSVLLTFDDGPHPAYTLQVAEKLNDRGIRGVFFVVGKRAEQAADLLPKLIEAGHEIGNHGFSHEQAPFFARRQYAADLEHCQQIVARATGVAPRLFRAPFGRLTPAVLLAARDLGLKIMHWSLDSNDWRCRSDEDADRCAEETIAAARKGDIILFHDHHPHLVRILDKVLPGLAAKGLI